MSSKKKYVTVGLDPELAKLLDDEALGQRRSRGFIVEEILREHYKMPWEPQIIKKGE